MTIALIASTGGHLTQLHRMAATVAPDPQARHWITFDTPQSRSLLEGERVTYVPFMRSRDLRGALANVPEARRIVREIAPRAAYSTGAGIAIPYLVAAAARGAESVYIESAARTQSPSLTGRILSGMPRIRTVTQYAHLARGRWELGASVFDGFPTMPSRVAATEPEAAPRVLVLMGTLAFPFERLADAITAHLPADAEITWQVGDSVTPEGLPGEVHRYLDSTALAALAARSTAVVAHAGCGSALTALDAGVWPVLVPRRLDHGEHVDDHQTQIADELVRRGLAVRADVETLSPSVLVRDYRMARVHA